MICAIMGAVGAEDLCLTDDGAMEPEGGDAGAEGHDPVAQVELAALCVRM